MVARVRVRVSERARPEHERRGRGRGDGCEGVEGERASVRKGARGRVRD